MIDASVGFTIVRHFDSTPEELWRYWTDPAEAATWWHPRGVSTPPETVEIDPRVGGRYGYVMVNDATGERYPTVGEFREMVPYEKMVLTWGKPDDDPEECPLITVTFEPLEGGTRMTFNLRGFSGEPGDGSLYDGWAGALDILGEKLAASKERR